MDTKPKRFILYLRVSGSDQTTDLQRHDLVEYAKNRGWSFEILEDTATGKNSNRPALKQLFALIKQRKIDGVAVWRADRLFRSLKDAVLHLSSWTEQGVLFYSHKDGIDLTTSHGRLLANLLFSLAEFEAELIKSRVVAGLHAAKARGVKLGRPQVITPEITKQIIDLRAKGISIRGIESLLGKKVSKTSIERQLKINGCTNNRLKKSSA